MGKKRKKPDKPVAPDPQWTLKNDMQSVTVGINTRLWLLRQQGLEPGLIRLGKIHTRLFLREHGFDYIPNRKPRRLISDHLVWDEENRRLCYTKRMIPIRFNDPHISGIIIDPAEPVQPSRACQAPAASKTCADNSDETDPRP